MSDTFSFIRSHLQAQRAFVRALATFTESEKGQQVEAAPQPADHIRCGGVPLTLEPLDCFDSLDNELQTFKLLSFKKKKNLLPGGMTRSVEKHIQTQTALPFTAR